MTASYLLCHRNATGTIPTDLYEAWLRDRQHVGFHRVRSLSLLAAWEEQWPASPWMADVEELGAVQMGGLEQAAV